MAHLAGASAVEALAAVATSWVPLWALGTRAGEDAAAAPRPRASARSGVWTRRLAAWGRSGVLVANVGFQEQRLCPAGAEVWQRDHVWAEAAALGPRWPRWGGLQGQRGWSHGARRCSFGG